MDLTLGTINSYWEVSKAYVGIGGVENRMGSPDFESPCASGVALEKTKRQKKKKESLEEGLGHMCLKRTSWVILIYSQG